MKGDFTSQIWSTHARHHLALRLEARIGLSPAKTKTGCVWDEGMIRSATQELPERTAENRTCLGVPSAARGAESTATPLTTSSTRTLRVFPTRAFSMCQLGTGSFLIASVSGVGSGSRRAAMVAS